MKLLPTPGIVGHQVSAYSAPQPIARRTASGTWLQILGAWLERSRQRQALADLDDRLLKDAGITRSEAARETGKPFWR